MEYEESLNRIKELGLEPLLEKNLTEIFGDSFINLNFNNITELLCRFKYNLILRTVNRTIPEDIYNKLKEESPVRLSRINSLYHDWEDDNQVGAVMQQILDTIGNEVKEEKILEWYGFEFQYGYYPIKLKKLILENIILLIDSDPARVKSIVKPWFTNLTDQGILSHLVEFVWHASAMHEILSLYKSFIFDRPADFISRYTMLSIVKNDFSIFISLFGNKFAIPNAVTEGMEESM